MPTLTTTADLEASLDHLRAAPADTGKLEMLVRRPDTGVREILDEGVLDETRGLVGDNWLSRATSRAIADGRHLDAMITVMSARMVALGFVIVEVGCRLRMSGLYARVVNGGVVRPGDAVSRIR